MYLILFMLFDTHDIQQKIRGNLRLMTVESSNNNRSEAFTDSVGVGDGANALLSETLKKGQPQYPTLPLASYNTNADRKSDENLEDFRKNPESPKVLDLNCSKKSQIWNWSPNSMITNAPINNSSCKDAQSIMTPENSSSDASGEQTSSSNSINVPSTKIHSRSRTPSPPSTVSSTEWSKRTTSPTRLLCNDRRNLEQFLEAIEHTTSPSDPETKLKILRWVESGSRDRPSSASMPTEVYPGEETEVQDKLQNLALSRDSLSLQVAALNEQVNTQRQKIHDLENLLVPHKSKPNVEEERSLSYLNNEANNKVNGDINHHSTTKVMADPHQGKMLNSSTADIEQLRLTEQQNMEIKSLQLFVQRLVAENERKSLEIKSLRNSLEENSKKMVPLSVVTGTSPADHIRNHQQRNHPQKCYTSQASQYQQQFDINDQLRRLLLLENDEREIQHSCSFPNNLCQSSSMTNVSTLPPLQSGRYFLHQQPNLASIPSSISHSALSTAMSIPPPLWNSNQPKHLAYEFDNGIPPALFKNNSLTFVYPQQTSTPLARQLAAELDELRHHHALYSSTDGRVGQNVLYSTASLPRSLYSKTAEYSPQHIQPNSARIPSLEASSSSGVTMKMADSDDEFSRRRESSNKSEFKRNRNRSTLRTFFDKFSHGRKGMSLQDLSLQGLRRSSTNRSIDSLPVVLRPQIQHFVDWNGQKCAQWMHLAGFAEYMNGAARCVRSGRHLLNMSNSELEKEIGIRNHMHRKRLRCLLGCIERNDKGGLVEPADKMDLNQVMLWLDDIGLPQLRDIFAENRIDGQMLLCLTAQDLIEMRVFLALNHATIARGIQFLRTIDFCIHRMEKHFVQDWLNRCPVPAEVERWSHACSVEWLKSIDLAEFVPNLAFSGLHGALMVYEPTFTSDTLAEMLQIPAHKTLLRRHLNTNFSNLLGGEIINHKREVLSQPYITYLSPTLRIKLMNKRNHSITRKKSKGDILVNPDARVCPDIVPQQNLVSKQKTSYETTDI